MLGRHIVTALTSKTYLTSAAERSAPRFIQTTCRTELLSHIGEPVTIVLELKSANATTLRVYPYQGTGVSISAEHLAATGPQYKTFVFTDTVKDWGGDIVTYNGGSIGIYDDSGAGGTVYVRNMTVRPGSPADVTCFVDQLTIRHGRDDTTSQPEASSASLDVSWLNSTATLPKTVEIGSTLTVDEEFPIGSGTLSRRFGGKITDIELGWDDAGVETPDHVVGQVIATGVSADLGRRVVGAVPYPQEADGPRIARIMSAAGVTLDPFYSDPGTVQIIARDIDSQPALEVARGVAESAGGIVWESRAGDVRYADANHRRGVPVAIVLDACDLLVSPKWVRDTDGLVNQVSIGYGTEPAGGGEQPRYTAQRDDSMSVFGTWGYTATTELAALSDAQAMGQLLLTRNREPVWVLTELPIDIAGQNSADTTTLLSLDMHSLIQLTGMPSAGSAPTSLSVWIEGWTETIAYGVHELALAVSGYCRTVPPPRWDDLDPAWTWDTVVPPSLTWDQATCLGPPVQFGRWNDAPASLRWDNVPATVTWDTYEQWIGA